MEFSCKDRLRQWSGQDTRARPTVNGRSRRSQKLSYVNQSLLMRPTLLVASGSPYHNRPNGSRSETKSRPRRYQP